MNEDPVQNNIKQGTLVGICSQDLQYTYVSLPIITVIKINTLKDTMGEINPFCPSMRGCPFLIYF